MADKKTILVIDDEPDVVTYLVTLFEDQGYSTICAKDGVDALDKVKQEKPDLITLDISMPEKSGIRFYRDMKENPEYSSIPIIMVTGVTGYANKPEEFQKFISTRKQVPPPEGFIAKPLENNREKLLEKVKELLA